MRPGVNRGVLTAPGEKEAPSARDCTVWYVTFERGELPPLYYFTVSISRRPLKTLVDLGSNHTLFGREGIKLIRDLRIITRRSENARIRTANGQIAQTTEDTELTVALENWDREITVSLLPNLAVPCIVGMDFLSKFKIELDFAEVSWHFADMSHTRYSFGEQSEVRVYWS